MKKLTITVVLLIALLALPIAAFPGVHADVTNTHVLQGDRIGEPQDLDPAWAYDTSSAELIMNVYDPLLFFNRTNMDSYIPRLATSWYFSTIDEVDPTTGLEWVQRLTFVIRDGVYFHSDGVNDIPGEGALMTPQDIEYTFERLLITDASTGPSWMVWEPLTFGDTMGNLNDTLYGISHTLNPINAYGWDTHCDEAIDHAIQSNDTCVWFNLVMPYQPILQILAQNWGAVMNKDWCLWHSDWPGMSIGDLWYTYHDPATSPLYSSDPSSSGGVPALRAALGTGPYMLNYWNKGAGNAWSIVKNENYWEGWTVARHEGWGPAEQAIGGHVDEYISNYIPEWSTRKLRFLGGLSDFCDVPRNYMDQVLGQAGVRCWYPLPQLVADACFFNFKVDTSSTHLGVIQPASTFNQYGAPPNIMEDQDFRRALTHMFDYATFLYAAFLNESVSPVTPIIPGISYYDASIGKMENPVANIRKEYGITGEAAGQLAYDMDLAVSYLQTAWGGALWANGFTMDAVYNEGNVARNIAATLMADAFNWINANYGTKFTLKVTSIPWGSYRTEQKARVMPYFIVGWLADYPDAHDFAQPFMQSSGAFSRFQGFLGVTSYPNAVVDGYVNAGIATVDPVQRQGNYTWLQHYWVDFAPGFITDQATGRHWERDWVQGWYYNAIYPGNYIYDLWKAVLFTPKDVDVYIVDFTPAVDRIEIGFPSPNNVLTPFGDAAVTVAVTVGMSAGSSVSSVNVIIAVGLRNEATGREKIIGTDAATLTKGGTYEADFDNFENPADAPITPGTYTLFAEVLVQSQFANDINMANNKVYQTTNGVTASAGLLADINVDGSADMADITMLLDWFMTGPSDPHWDIRGDLNVDAYIDMADISIAIDQFMKYY